MNWEIKSEWIGKKGRDMVIETSRFTSGQVWRGGRLVGVSGMSNEVVRWIKELVGPMNIDGEDRAKGQLIAKYREEVCGSCPVRKQGCRGMQAVGILAEENWAEAELPAEAQGALCT